MWEYKSDNGNSWVSTRFDNMEIQAQTMIKCSISNVDDKGNGMVRVEI